MKLSEAKAAMETQEVRDTKNMEHLPRKAPGSEQSQFKKEAMWAPTGKAIGMGLPKLFGVHILLLCVPDGEHETTGFNVCPIGFWSYFGPISFLFPVLPFWNESIYPELLYIEST